MLSLRSTILRTASAPSGRSRDLSVNLHACPIFSRAHGSRRRRPRGPLHGPGEGHPGLRLGRRRGRTAWSRSSTTSPSTSSTGWWSQTPDGVRRFIDAPEVARTAERAVTLTIPAAEAAQLPPTSLRAPVRAARCASSSAAGGGASTSPRSRFRQNRVQRKPDKGASMAEEQTPAGRARWRSHRPRLPDRHGQPHRRDLRGRDHRRHREGHGLPADEGLRGRLRPHDLRPGVHQHRLVPQLDHLHRRRGRRARAPRLPDRAALRALHLPRGGVPADLRRAPHEGPARHVGLPDHPPHLRPREHQEVRGGLPLRRPPDGDAARHHRRALDLLPGRQEHRGRRWSATWRPSG